MILGVAGAAVVITGRLPLSDAREVAVTRGLPILAFLVAITVLAELADRAGVFDAAADVCARGHSVVRPRRSGTALRRSRKK